MTLIEVLKHAVKALVSDYLANSEKWTQLELVALTIMRSRKRSCDETVEGGRLKGLCHAILVSFFKS